MNDYDNTFFDQCDMDILNSPKLLHIAQFFQNPSESFKKLLSLVKKVNGPLISFSPGIVYSLEGIEALLPIFSKTHVLFLNTNEIKILTKKAPEEGSRELLEYGPQIVVCTLGEKGALITTHDTSILINGIIVKNIVDTTSAGDSFAGAFLYGLLENWDLKRCGEFANKVASLSVNGYGCIWMKNQMLSLLKN
jgi:sugar/nucleoside kinase (ribokinase family)